MWDSQCMLGAFPVACVSMGDCMWGVGNWSAPLLFSPPPLSVILTVVRHDVLFSVLHTLLATVRLEVQSGLV